MMMYDWSMITAYVLMCLLVLILLQIMNSSHKSRFQPCLFSAPEIFIPDAYGTKNRRCKTGAARKWSRYYGAGFWSVGHGYTVTFQA